MNNIYPRALQNKTLIHHAEDGELETAVRAVQTDAQLVELVLSGDEAAFEDLFDRHKRLVGSIAARYFRQAFQIEEILQISFAKAFQELPRFRGSYYLSFVSWIARIATNSCLDILRNQKRKPENPIADIEAFELRDTVAGKTSEECLIDRDLADKLLSHLADDDRALLQMLYAEEMSVADAADQMGWSKSKTKVRAWRARNSLRRVLKRYL